MSECCLVCGTKEHLTSVGGEILCYGCEHKIFYADQDMELMTIMYGNE